MYKYPGPDFSVSLSGISHSTQTTVMGHLTRQPGINEPHIANAKPRSQYSPTDEIGALLTKAACRCCGCKHVINQRHLTWVSDHLFCPDCIAGPVCSVNGACSHNVRSFLEKYPWMRPDYKPPVRSYVTTRYDGEGYDSDAD